LFCRIPRPSADLNWSSLITRRLINLNFYRIDRQFMSSTTSGSTSDLVNVAGLSILHNIIIGVISFISLTARSVADTENVCLFDHFTTSIESKEKSWFLVSPALIDPTSFRNKDFLWHEIDLRAIMNLYDILGRLGDSNVTARDKDWSKLNLFNLWSCYNCLHHILRLSHHHLRLLNVHLWLLHVHSLRLHHHRVHVNSARLLRLHHHRVHVNSARLLSHHHRLSNHRWYICDCHRLSDHLWRWSFFTTGREYQIECGLLLDVVVRQSSAILKLISAVLGEVQFLLIWWGSFLVLNLSFQIFDGVGRLNV